MIAFSKIAVAWTTRLPAMDRCLEIVHLLSQICRPFNGMSRDKMFDVDREMIKRHRFGGWGAPAAPLWALRIHVSIQTFELSALRSHTHGMALRLFSWRSAYSQRSPVASTTSENSWIHTVGFPHYSGAKHSALTSQRRAGAAYLLLLLLKAARD